MTEETAPETKVTDPNALRLFRIYTQEKAFSVRAHYHLVTEQTIELIVRRDDGSCICVAAFPLIVVNAVIDFEYKAG